MGWIWRARTVRRGVRVGDVDEVGIVDRLIYLSNLRVRKSMQMMRFENQQYVETDADSICR